jgi:hypothetical protein
MPNLRLAYGVSLVLRLSSQESRTLAAAHPAEGGKDPNSEWGKLLGPLGASFLDEIRAAAGCGQLLLSEDQAMRILAQTEYGVPGCWLQPVLMVAAERGAITSEAYLGATLELIDANEEFISVSGNVIIAALKDADGHALPSSFRKLASRLGGTKADLQSHVRVAFDVVKQTWSNTALSPTVRQGIVGNLLDNLIRDRSKDELEAVIKAFDDLASMTRNESLRRYLSDWRRGHFLN